MDNWTSYKNTKLEQIKKNAEYLAKIDRAIAQKEAGTMQEHELIYEKTANSDSLSLS